MDLDRARFLISPRGREALPALSPGLEALPLTQLASTLRREFPSFEAAALAEQVTLRAKARERFGETEMLFSPAGLEMMTHPLVAARRAERLASLGLPVADLTCGIGGDLRACSDAGLRAAGLERDPAAALLARANAPGASVVRGDACAPPFALDRFAVVIDPSRREGGARRFDPAAFSPPWDVALGLLASARAGVLKAPPGIDHRHLPPAAETEFVQLGRTLREAAVWTGPGVQAGVTRAVLLPAGATLDSTEPEAPAAPVAPRDYLFDPESCVTRAGLVRHLAHRLGARMLDEQVAYLTAPVPAFEPLAVTLRILDVVPFSVARLKQALTARGWRPDEIRRRAFPIEPDELRRLLGRMEGRPVTLVCTTLGGRRTVFACEPVTAAVDTSERIVHTDRQ